MADGPRCVASQSTSKEQSITIKSSGGLSEDEIQKMVRDAEQYATADKARKETIEAKNEVETLIYSSERSLEEYKVRLDTRCKACQLWRLTLVLHQRHDACAADPALRLSCVYVDATSILTDYGYNRLFLCGCSIA